MWSIKNISKRNNVYIPYALCPYCAANMMHKHKTALHITKHGQCSGVTSTSDCIKEANDGKGSWSACCFENKSPIYFTIRCLSAQREISSWRFSASFALHSFFFFFVKLISFCPCQKLFLSNGFSANRYSIYDKRMLLVFKSPIECWWERLYSKHV